VIKHSNQWAGALLAVAVLPNIALSNSIELKVDGKVSQEERFQQIIQRIKKALIETEERNGNYDKSTGIKESFKDLVDFDLYNHSAAIPDVPLHNGKCLSGAPPHPPKQSQETAVLEKEKSELAPKVGCLLKKATSNRDTIEKKTKE
jgi:hypothetical protein